MQATEVLTPPPPPPPRRACNLQRLQRVKRRLACTIRQFYKRRNSRPFNIFRPGQNAIIAIQGTEVLIKHLDSTEQTWRHFPDGSTPHGLPASGFGANPSALLCQMGGGGDTGRAGKEDFRQQTSPRTYTEWAAILLPKPIAPR
jgi:hypothetical protein